MLVLEILISYLINYTLADTDNGPTMKHLSASKGCPKSETSKSKKITRFPERCTLVLNFSDLETLPKWKINFCGDIFQWSVAPEI